MNGSRDCRRSQSSARIADPHAGIAKNSPTRKAPPRSLYVSHAAIHVLPATQRGPAGLLLRADASRGHSPATLSCANVSGRHWHRWQRPRESLLAMPARATLLEPAATTPGPCTGTVTKPAGRAVEVARRDSSEMVFFGNKKRGERSSQSIENTPYKAGKPRLTFTTEEMRLRVLRHLLSLQRNRRIDPLKVARTIARR